MALPQRLPQAFLRGLEGDLRSLCADARRRNPQVKEAAERVILALKEADSQQSESQAADEAASAFCAACELPDSSMSTTVLAVQLKVTLRAVSSLHKLLTHRALSTARLPEVLNALERLGAASVDDNITLKVLQGLLSLLTVRQYAKSLSENDLSRAFSLLFVLRTSRSNTGGNPASNALSAISHMSGSNDHGVIEQTSKAAFRQVSSDLFASAADAAVKMAVQKEATAGQLIPLQEFPSEAKAAYSLLVDLCKLAAGEQLNWLTNSTNREASQIASLELGVALEVIDDSISSNIALFAGHPVFADLLSGPLCSTIHQLLRSTVDKTTLKSLLGLLVTFIRGYWRQLRSDTEKLFSTLMDMSKIDNATSVQWSHVYAMEALRCIFKSGKHEPSPLIDFVEAFDLNENSGQPIKGVIVSAYEAMVTLQKEDLQFLPPGPITGQMKAFANTMVMTKECLMSITIGLYVQVIATAQHAAKSGKKDVALVLIQPDVISKSVALLGNIIRDGPTVNSPKLTRATDESSLNALKMVTTAIGQVSMMAADCDLGSIQEDSISALALACRDTVRGRLDVAFLSPEFANKVLILFNVLFDVENTCRDNLARSWVPIVEALEQLDDLIRVCSLRAESESSSFAQVEMELKPKLDLVFTSTVSLRWESCHDLISALVQCSRQSMAGITRRAKLEDQAKGDTDIEARVFGIERAEVAIVQAFQREKSDSDIMPCTLWQLLTGHLTSVCTDSSLQFLRLLALSSLTRIACRAISGGSQSFVSHENVITPFLDLFTAVHSDVRSSALSAIYTILETQGDNLKGEAAWTAVLKTMSAATGSFVSEAIGGDKTEGSSRIEVRTGTQYLSSSPGGGEMVSEGFKVVQLTADGFLPSLGPKTLPLWMEILGQYSLQEEDVNVALTSIGLLWRTADILAKDSARLDEDELWIQLFEILKGISMDERPEIRNCAVKTLTGTLQAHNHRLSAMAWNGCVARALLPLLEQVMQGGAVKVHGEDNSAAGKTRGDVRLLLHHSRDTPRKQWNETRVLALAGVAKVLRTAMPRLAVLQDASGRPLFLMLTDGGSDGLWRKMLRAAGVAAASRDGEVAVAGVSALLELLNAAGFVVDEQITNEVLEEGSKLEGSVSAPGSLGGKHESSSPVAWITGVMGSTKTTETTKSHDESELNTKAKMKELHKLNESKGSAVILWEAVWIALAEAVKGTSDPDSTNVSAVQSMRESKIVEERALRMLGQGLVDAREKLPHKFTSSSSQILVDVLMDLGFGSREGLSNMDGKSASGLTDVQKVTLKGLEELSFGNDEKSWETLLQCLLTILQRQKRGVESERIERSVLGIILRQYSGEQMPGAVKVAQLGSVLISLEKIVLDRGNGAANNGSNSSSALWMLGTDTLITAVRCSTQDHEVAVAANVWDIFVTIVERFLYTERRLKVGNIYNRDMADLELAEDYDMRVIECVKEAMGHVGSAASIETKRRLVRLLSRGAEEKESGRPRFVRACQRSLFRLADAVWTDSEARPARRMAEESASCLVETCGRVLAQFVADGMRAGRCPLPAARRAEAVFLLQQLKILNRSGGENGKKHLVSLYPRLCECVDSRDDAVRMLARELLDESAAGERSGSVAASG